MEAVMKPSAKEQEKLRKAAAFVRLTLSKVKTEDSDKLSQKTYDVLFRLQDEMKLWGF
jgi:hypothetical protein